MEIVDCFLLCSVNLDRGRFRSAGLHPRRAQDTGLPDNWNVPKIPSGLTVEAVPQGSTELGSALPGKIPKFPPNLDVPSGEDVSDSYVSGLLYRPDRRTTCFPSYHRTRRRPCP